MPSYYKHTCLICGGTFNARSETRNYCPRCLRNGNYERYCEEQKALGNEIPPIRQKKEFTKTCPYCGKIFVTKDNNKIACKECTEKALNMRNCYRVYCHDHKIDCISAKEFRRYIPRLFAMYPEKTPGGELIMRLIKSGYYEKKDTMKELLDICNKAYSTGQSYGMYVSDRTYVNTCYICGEQFFTEDSEETVCKECKKIFTKLNAV